MAMKQLPQTFKRDRYDFVQVASLPGQVFIYEQRKPILPDGRLAGPSDRVPPYVTAYRVCAWEVVVARWQKERKTPVAHYREGWVYPTSKQWGYYGFTLMTLERAKEKAEELSARFRGKPGR